MAKRLHLIQRHDEANRLIGLGLDGDDPPFGPKIVEISCEANGVSFGQPLTLNAEKDRFRII